MKVVKYKFVECGLLCSGLKGEHFKALQFLVKSTSPLWSMRIHQSVVNLLAHLRRLRLAVFFRPLLVRRRPRRLVDVGRFRFFKRAFLAAALNLVMGKYGMRLDGGRRW